MREIIVDINATEIWHIGESIAIGVNNVTKLNAFQKKIEYEPIQIYEDFERTYISEEGIKTEIIKKGIYYHPLDIN